MHWRTEPKRSLRIQLWVVVVERRFWLAKPDADTPVFRYYLVQDSGRNIERCEGLFEEIGWLEYHAVPDSEGLWSGTKAGALWPANRRRISGMASRL